MVEETIKVIKETEAQAQAIVKEADVQCKKILEDASKEAEQLKADQIEAIRKNSDAMLADAREKGVQTQQAAMTNVENEMVALKELASGKEKEAINLVIAELV